MSVAGGNIASEKRPLALVTGGQQGIGEAISRALFSSGYDVAIADLHTGAGAEHLRQRWAGISELYCLVADVSREASVMGLYDQLAELGCAAPSVLINNAANQTWGPLLDTALVDWQRTIDVNLTGTFLMTREFARRHQSTKQGHGCIVNLGSGCNHVAFPKLAAYAASKGGVEMLTKASALELGSMGIRVNCVAPGAIETERTRAETQDYADSWSPLTPLGRIGTVNDVAQAVVSLVSDNMRFVSGETIRIDGGLFSRAVWPSEY